MDDLNIHGFEDDAEQRAALRNLVTSIQVHCYRELVRTWSGEIESVLQPGDDSSIQMHLQEARKLLAQTAASLAYPDDPGVDDPRLLLREAVMHVALAEARKRENT